MSLLTFHHYIPYFLDTNTLHCCLTVGGQQGIMCPTTETNYEAKFSGTVHSCQLLHWHTVQYV